MAPGGLWFSVLQSSTPSVLKCNFLACAGRASTSHQSSSTNQMQGKGNLIPIRCPGQLPPLGSPQKSLCVYNDYPESREWPALIEVPTLEVSAQMNFTCTDNNLRPHYLNKFLHRQLPAQLSASPCRFVPRNSSELQKEARTMQEMFI